MFIPLAIYQIKRLPFSCDFVEVNLYHQVLSLRTPAYRHSNGPRINYSFNCPVLLTFALQSEQAKLAIALSLSTTSMGATMNSDRKGSKSGAGCIAPFMSEIDLGRE
jgi:hypothetical protein